MKVAVDLLLITILVIHHSSIASSQSCPVNCRCFNANHKVVCSLKYNFSDLMKNLPNDVTHLIISGNKRTLDLDDNTLPESLKQLTSLQLNNFRISKISNNAFQFLKKLRILNLSGNGIVYIGMNVFSPIEHLSELNLASNNLDTIPPITALNLHKLILSSNNIDSLDFPVSYVNCRSLNSIKMSNNPIQKITADAFKHLLKSNLKSLSLKSCHISKIHKDAFKPIVTSLISLDLSGIAGPISSADFSMAMNPFRGVTSLKNLAVTLSDAPKADIFRKLSILRLSLQKTPIKEVDGAVFGELNDLTSLTLEDCGIVKVIPSKLSSLKNIKELFLDKNGLTEIERDTFSQFKHLKTLSLRRNNIKILKVGCFEGLVKLEKLYLSKSGIVKIESGALNLPFLSDLNLADNELNGIFTFESDGIMKTLRNLDLSMNIHLKVEEGFFNKLEHLHILKLTKTAVTLCSCDDFKTVDTVTLPSACSGKKNVIMLGGKRKRATLKCHSHSAESKSGDSRSSSTSTPGVVAGLFGTVGVCGVVAYTTYRKRDAIKSRLNKHIRIDYKNEYSRTRSCPTALDDDSETQSIAPLNHTPMSPIGSNQGSDENLLRHTARRTEDDVFLSMRSLTATSDHDSVDGVPPPLIVEDDEEAIIERVGDLDFADFGQADQAVTWFNESAGSVHLDNYKSGPTSGDNSLVTVTDAYSQPQDSLMTEVPL